MGKPEFSSSEPYLPPKTLAERLKAQANGLAEIEAASFMAERFAPDLQTQAANDEEEDNPPSEPMAEPSSRSSLRRNDRHAQAASSWRPSPLLRSCRSSPLARSIRVTR